MAHKPDQPVHRIDLVRGQRGKTLGLRRDGVQIIVGALCHAVSRQGGQLRGVFGQGIGQGQQVVPAFLTLLGLGLVVRRQLLQQQAARALARPDAAERIADIILEEAA